MANYYQGFVEFIDRGNYDLNALVERIKNFEIRGDIDSDQSNTLLELAREKAKEQDKYGDFQTQIDSMATAIAAINLRLDLIEQKFDALCEETGIEIDISVPASSDNIAEFVQPTGAHDAYYTGDKVTFNGRKWVCTAPEGYACTYSPSAYPAYWEDLGAA